MKVMITVRNIFRGILLISLIFRLFFLEKQNYNWDISSYILLAIGLLGMIILEIIIYFHKNNN
jgi:hypothetical protein